MNGFALKLGKNHYYIEHGFAYGRGRIELLPCGRELHVVLTQCVHQFAKVERGATESIQLIDYYLAYNAVLHVLYHCLELRAVRILAAVTSVYIFFIWLVPYLLLT